MFEFCADKVAAGGFDAIDGVMAGDVKSHLGGFISILIDRTLRWIRKMGLF